MNIDFTTTPSSDVVNKNDYYTDDNLDNLDGILYWCTVSGNISHQYTVIGSFSEIICSKWREHGTQFSHMTARSGSFFLPGENVLMLKG